MDSYREYEPAWNSIFNQEEAAFSALDHSKPATSTIQGEFHLKSALKTFSDYMKNSYNRKDYGVLLRNVADVPLESPEKLLQFLWREFVIRRNIIPHRLVTEFIADTYYDSGINDEVLKMVEAECKELYDHDVGEQGIAAMKIILRESEKVETVLGRADQLKFILQTIIIHLNREDGSEPCPLIEPLEDGATIHRVSADLTLVTTKRWCNIYSREFKGNFHVSHLVNVLDKITERSNMIKYLILCFFTPYRDQYPTINTLYKIISYGDDLIGKVGNNGFKALANYEALCVGMIISKGNREAWDVGSFLGTMIKETKDMGVFESDWCDNTMNVLKHEGLNSLSSLHGIYRIWGHPVVNLEDGLRKLRSVALKKKTIPSDAAWNTYYMFMETFFMQYYRRHGFYPPWTHVGGEDTYISTMLKEECLIDVSNSQYKLEDWEGIQCEKAFEIPATYSLASCVKDRAISPTRSELARSISSRKTVMDQSNRRGVLKWLTSKMMPVDKFLKKINDSGMDPDDLVIGLYPKERELKVEARFFALMSFNMRLYFTITESLVNDHILDYFPMVTMSDDLLSLTKKLDVLGKKHISVKQGVVYFTVNLDFRKWNQQMRGEMTIHMFEALDRLFGMTNLFNRTHEIFSSSYIYLSSGEYVPTLSPRNNLTTQEPYSWMGDPSGKEGLRQKPWTIMTACDIMFVARRHGVKIDLVGGGDNQVLMVETNTTLISEEGIITNEGYAECQAQMAGFMKSLSSYMEYKGLPLKVEETWISPDLLMFFKMMIFRSAVLISPLKQASRIFPLSNDQIMTAGNMAATISSGITVLSSKDTQILPAHLFGRVCAKELAILLCSNHPLFKGGTEWAKKLKICRGKRLIEISVPQHVRNAKHVFLALTLHHKVLGGIAIISPLSLMMRGFPDPLSEHLTWLNMISRHVPNYLEYGSFSVNHKTPWSHLLEDPVSVNHDAPVFGLAVLRREAERAIVESTDITNVDFHQMALSCNKSEAEALASALCSSKSLEVRVLHDVMGATLYGYFNSIAAKVDKSTTILRLNKTSNVVQIIRAQESVCLSYLVGCQRSTHDLKMGKCPTSTARLYRTVSWDGKQIVGITTPHPAAFLSCSTGIHDCDHSYVQGVKTGGYPDITKRGPHQIYMGSYTAEKFKPTAMAAAYGEESLLSRAIHLLKLVNWRYDKDDPMSMVLRKVLESLTDADPSHFYGEMEWISGDAEHRYHDQATKHGGVPNIAYTILSYCRINTTTFRKHSRGTKNETIHFQAIIIWVSNMLLNKNYEGITHWHESCKECIEPTKGKVTTQLHGKLSFPTLKGNMYAYLPSERIRFHYHDLKKMEQLRAAAHRSLLLQNMTGYDKKTAALSLLSGVIASGGGKDRAVDTASSIMMWVAKVKVTELVPLVVLRQCVDFLMKTGDWVWPHPKLKSRVLRMLEHFIFSMDGRSDMEGLNLNLSEVEPGDIGIVQSIVDTIMANRQVPRVMVNKVSPMFNNDVICAKIFESDHVIHCNACLKSVSISPVEYCNGAEIRYQFKICSVTLPVIKEYLTALNHQSSKSRSEWTPMHVRKYELVPSCGRYIEMDEISPLLSLTPLGEGGVMEMSDLINSVEGTVYTDCSSIGVEIWRRFKDDRPVLIVNQSKLAMDWLSDAMGLSIEESDCFADSESVTLGPGVYVRPLAENNHPGWYVLTSMKQMDILKRSSVNIYPTMVFKSERSVTIRNVMIVKMEPGNENTWPDLQQFYLGNLKIDASDVPIMQLPRPKQRMISIIMEAYIRTSKDMVLAVHALKQHLKDLLDRGLWKRQEARLVGTALLSVLLSQERKGVDIAKAVKYIKFHRNTLVAVLGGRNNRTLVSSIRDCITLFGRGVMNTDVVRGDKYVIRLDV